MMANKTSVLMSVYKNEQPNFFDASLKSILCDQIQKPDEFVLVCDGPLTDELESVISKYNKQYPDIFKVFRTEQNQGLGKALNFGLTHCSNAIIIRADSDDICVPERIAVQVDYLNKNPNISIVSSFIDEFNEDYLKPINVKKLPLKNDELVEMAKIRNPINHMASAFRKDAIIDIGSYHHIPYVEDYELWVRAIVNGYQLGNIDKILVHARIGNGMVKRRGNKEYIKSWKILNKYMIQNKMIGKFGYFRNMTLIRAFVYMPTSLKKSVYKNVLRKE